MWPTLPPNDKIRNDLDANPNRNEQNAQMKMRKRKIQTIWTVSDGR